MLSQVLCLFTKHKHRLSASGTAQSKVIIRRQDCSCDSGIQHHQHVARLCSRLALRCEVPVVVGQRQAIRWWFVSASLMLYYSRLKLGPFSS